MGNWSSSYSAPRPKPQPPVLSPEDYASNDEALYEAKNKLEELNQTIKQIDDDYNDAQFNTDAAQYQLSKYPSPDEGRQTSCYKNANGENVCKTKCGEMVLKYRRTLDKLSSLSFDDLTQELEKLMTARTTWKTKLDEVYSKIKNALNKIKDQLEEIVRQGKEIDAILYSQLLDAYKRYNEIKGQNDVIANKIDDYNKTYLLKNQSDMYKNGRIDILSRVNKYLLYVYYALTVGLLLLFIFVSDMNMLVKVFIMIFAILFPFFIYYLEKYIYFVYKYINSFIKGKAFVE
jgi:DNA repair exonuclease SbcCD ATPase subunit